MHAAHLGPVYGQTKEEFGISHQSTKDRFLGAVWFSATRPTHPKSSLCPFLPAPCPLWTSLPRLPCPLTSGWAWPMGGTYRGSEEERGAVAFLPSSLPAPACICGGSCISPGPQLLLGSLSTAQLSLGSQEQQWLPEVAYPWGPVPCPHLCELSLH